MARKGTSEEFRFFLWERLPSREIEAESLSHKNNLC
jgi:hypothetical protein